MKIMSAATMGITGLVTVGLLSLSNLSAAAQDDRAEDWADDWAKREEDAVTLVLMDDTDDDDTNDDTDGNTNGDTNGDTTGDTRNSASTNDNTRSNVTKASRDRDHSRGDKTKDWTRDGGDRTRDWSGNKTNDKSRNDTRGRG